MDLSETLHIVETALLGNTITNEQKIQVAKGSEQLKIDTLLLPKDNNYLIDQVCNDIKSCNLVIATKPTPKNIDEAFNSIKKASKPGLRLVLSNDMIKDINLDDAQNKKDLLNLITDALKYTKKLTDYVDLVIEYNINKIHKILLYRIIETACESNATVVTIKDNSGLMLPFEVEDLIDGIFQNLPDSEKTLIGVNFSNKSALATANTLSAVYKGARQIDVTYNIDDHESSGVILKHFIDVIYHRKDRFKLKTNLNTSELKYLYPELFKE